MKRIRRLPTILALFILLTGIAGGIFLLGQNANWFLQAEPATIPKQIKITNITDSSFAVSWTTDGQTLGFIKYNRDQNLDLVANDDRNENSGNDQKYYTHHITAKNLDPKTTYYFKLGSEKKTFDDNGQPYEITTGAPIQGQIPESDLAYGTVTKSDNSPVTDAIVYLSLNNVVPQSTFVKEGGSFLIPLNQAWSIDLNGPAVYDKEKAIESIFVQGSLQETATVTGTTGNDSPLPAIVLGQDNDFQITPSGTAAEPTPVPASKFTFEQLPPPTEVIEEITIINPAEGEPINTAKPAFMGTGPAKESLTITIESSTIINQTVATDQQGNWEWSPPSDLEPGTHKITVSYTDEKGILHTLSRSFIVLAADSSDLPAIESTPSGTIAPTKSPTPSPKSTLTATPTPKTSPTPTTTRTATATPSPSLTPTKTASPSPTLTLRPTRPATSSGTIEPGTLTPTLLLSIIGVALVIIGFLAVI